MGYGIVWLIGAIAGYFFFDELFGASTQIGSMLGVATAASVLAGAVGGATAMLGRLHRHVSIQQDIQQQSILFYFLQPISGLLAGLLVFYIITLPVALVINYAVHRQFLFADVLALPNFASLQILLGWLAGFYQQRGLDRLNAFLKRGLKNTPSDIIPAATVIDENAPFYYKAWHAYQKRMRYWSYTWGMFILLYGLVWMVGLIYFYFLRGGLESGLESNSQTAAATLIFATWPAALAGGLGGVCNLLYDLYRHISIKRDFHRQHLMSYLVQPIIGTVFGLVMYLLLATGYLSIIGQEAQVVDSTQIIMMQMVFGWIAGFRQQTLTDFTLTLIQYLIALIKLIARLLNPFVLFDKAKRDPVLDQIGKQTELFRVVEDG